MVYKTTCPTNMHFYHTCRILLNNNRNLLFGGSFTFIRDKDFDLKVSHTLGNEWVKN